MSECNREIICLYHLGALHNKVYDLQLPRIPDIIYSNDIDFPMSFDKGNIIVNNDKLIPLQDEFRKICSHRHAGMDFTDCLLAHECYHLYQDLHCLEYDDVDADTYMIRDTLNTGGNRRFKMALYLMSVHIGNGNNGNEFRKLMIKAYSEM